MRKFLQLTVICSLLAVPYGSINFIAFKLRISEKRYCDQLSMKMNTKNRLKCNKLPYVSFPFMKFAIRSLTWSSM